MELSKKTILKFIRPSPNSVFKCHNLQGIKFLTRLCLGVSDLREDRFKHSFQDFVSTIHLIYSIRNIQLSDLRHTDCSNLTEARRA